MISKHSTPDSKGKCASYKMRGAEGRASPPDPIPDSFAAAPREPATVEEVDGPQYLYYSDGNIYKLVVHMGPSDAEPVSDERCGTPLIRRHLLGIRHLVG
jgi:hypothetical protein